MYLDDELFELDEHVSMAVEILKADSGSHLKDIRFKLVPGRMPEERFWAAVFAILNDGGVDIEGVIGEVNSIDDDYETGDEFDDKIDGILHTPRHHHPMMEPYTYKWTTTRSSLMPIPQTPYLFISKRSTRNRLTYIVSKRA